MTLPSHLQVLLMNCVAMLCVATANAADVVVLPLQRHTNEFSGREITRDFRIQSSKPLEGRFVWTVSVRERTMARGEQTLRVEAASADVRLKFRFEPLREELVLPVMINMAVVVGREEVVREQLQLELFPQDPFGHRGEWLRSLDIHVFDPLEKTATILVAAKIPFTEVTNVARIRAMKGGTLLIGSHVSLRDYRGLALATIEAAGQGTRVLWLPAADGAFPFEAFDSAAELNFCDTKIVKELDKRLDATAWPGVSSPIVSRLKVQAVGKRIVAQVGEQGWPWMEADWPASGGQFIFCGFAIVDQWKNSPTPRYMLLHILERLTAEEASQ